MSTPDDDATPACLPRTDEVDGLTVADVMHAGVASMPSTVTVAELRAWFATSASRRLAVIADDGRYRASLTPDDVGPDARGERPALECARDRETLAPDRAAASGRDLVLATDARRIPVVDDDGRFHGVLALTSDLQHFACRAKGTIGHADTAVRRATADDAEAVGRLLHDFNREYDEPTPEPGALAERVRELLAAGDTQIIVVGPGPDGLAVMRFRAAIWSRALECYLAELYVAPDRRGHGLGRALMEAAMQRARDEGADRMDLGTSEDDTAARGLYESLGFSNREGRPDGPVNLLYEREL